MHAQSLSLMEPSEVSRGRHLRLTLDGPVKGKEAERDVCGGLGGRESGDVHRVQYTESETGRDQNREQRDEKSLHLGELSNR